MRLMGMDPEGDYGAFPYHFDRNPIVLAAEAGLGSPAAADIEVRGDVELARRHQFTVERAKSDEFDRIRHSIAEEVERFQSQRADLVRRYHGQYVAMLGGEVALSGDSMASLGNRDALLKKIGRDQGILIKQVLPAEQEEERLEVYSSL
jgi:hypothetical protein